MTDDIHSCSLFCDLPACIKRQRDEYRQGLIDALPVQTAPLRPLTAAQMKSTSKSVWGANNDQTISEAWRDAAAAQTGQPAPDVIWDNHCKINEASFHFEDLPDARYIVNKHGRYLSYVEVATPQPVQPAPVAQAEPINADSRDTERLDWLQSQTESCGFQDMHVGNRWTFDGPFMFVRDAIDAAIQAKDATPQPAEGKP